MILIRKIFLHVMSCFKRIILHYLNCRRKQLQQKNHGLCPFIIKFGCKCNCRHIFFSSFWRHSKNCVFTCIDAWSNPNTIWFLLSWKLMALLGPLHANHWCRFNKDLFCLPLMSFLSQFQQLGINDPFIPCKCVYVSAPIKKCRQP